MDKVTNEVDALTERMFDSKNSETRLYADAVQASPEMEHQDLGNVRTASPSPRVKLETTKPSKAIDSGNVNNESSVNLHTEEREQDTLNVDKEMLMIDARGVEISDINEYHPDTLTPLQAGLVWPQSPINTHIRMKATVPNGDNILNRYQLFKE